MRTIMGLGAVPLKALCIRSQGVILLNTICVGALRPRTSTYGRFPAAGLRPGRSFQSIVRRTADENDGDSTVETGAIELAESNGLRPSPQSKRMRTARQLFGAFLVTICLLWMYSTGSWLLRIGTAVAGGCMFATYGYLRKSLSLSGAIAAAVVGGVTLIASFRCTVVLLGFFFASSAMTRFGERMKDIDDQHKVGGQRDWVQVLCNGAVPSIVAAALCWFSGGVDLPIGMPGTPSATTWLAAAYLGYYACCCGDTWASELGVLSSTPPRLVTTFKTVRPGTNGGVTLLGLLASVSGGLFVGLCFAAASWISSSITWPSSNPQISLGQTTAVIILGAAAGERCPIHTDKLRLFHL
mmetsp:Transcript_34269/g.97141  ORF Transcript_34269/g.97141 Transcript_34269/m.97141 type:complete len:355 (-) Transcript_34269:465-1529(-)